MNIDFHSHILPGIDDGAGSAEEAAELLKILFRDGVDTVVLTPHFYRNQKSISEFLTERSAAYGLLIEKINRVTGIPDIKLGCECYYYDTFTQENLSELCIQGTDFLMLELPFEKFTERFLLKLKNQISKSRCRIILAHIERYLGYNSADTIAELVSENNVLCQMNCSSVKEADFFRKRSLMRLLDRGIVHIIGTDAHNLTSRPPFFAYAKRIIEKHGGNVYKNICERGEMVLNNESIRDIIKV